MSVSAAEPLLQGSRRSSGADSSAARGAGVTRTASRRDDSYSYQLDSSSPINGGVSGRDIGMSALDASRAAAAASLRRLLPLSASSAHGHTASGGSASSTPGIASALSAPPMRVRRPARGRILYEQTRARVCVPPLCVLTFAAAVVCTGVLLLLPALPLHSASQLGDLGTDILGYSLVAVGAALPVLALIACLVVATPSRRRAAHDAFLADGLLEELLSAPAITEHYDVYGEELAVHGTVVLLAGATAPRVANRAFAEALGAHYKVISMDLPGHGSLVNVGFSLARCERVVTRIIERELALGAQRAPPALVGSTAMPIGASAAARRSAAPKGAEPGLSSSDEDARIPLGSAFAKHYGSSVHLQSSMSTANAPVSATAAMAARFGSFGRANFGMSLGALGAGIPPAQPQGPDSPYRKLSAIGDGGEPEYFSPAQTAPGSPVPGSVLSPSAPTPSSKFSGSFFSPAAGVSAVDTYVGTPVTEGSDPVLVAAAAAATARTSMVALNSVVIIAYGASAYVASYIAARHAPRIAGLVLLGPVPQYATSGSCFGPVESMYRLRWVAALANAGIKSRIRTHPKVSEDDRAALLSHDWHFGVLPDYMASVHDETLLLQLRALPRAILVLGPIHWTAIAKSMFLVRHVNVEPARGVKDDKLPTLNPAKVQTIATTLIAFVRDAYGSYDASMRERAFREQASVRQGSSVAEPRAIPHGALRAASSTDGDSTSRRRDGTFASISTTAGAMLGRGGGSIGHASSFASASSPAGTYGHSRAIASVRGRTPSAAGTRTHTRMHSVSSGSSAGQRGGVQAADRESPAVYGSE